MSELYYKPKITDGYLVKKTNRINWDTLDKEIYWNVPYHHKKIFRDGSPLEPNMSLQVHPIPSLNLT